MQIALRLIRDSFLYLALCFYDQLKLVLELDKITIQKIRIFSNESSSRYSISFSQGTGGTVVKYSKANPLKGALESLKQPHLVPCNLGSRLHMPEQAFCFVRK